MHGLLRLLEIGKDAGWLAAMIVICVATFVVSSVFVNRRLKHHG
jgi:hypothetical protein